MPRRVEADRPGYVTGAVERHLDRPTLEPLRRATAGGQRDRCTGLTGHGESRDREQRQEETATHEGRQSSSAGVRFSCPVSARELERRLFESVKVIGSGRVGSAFSARLGERGVPVGEEAEEPTT